MAQYANVEYADMDMQTYGFGDGKARVTSTEY
jgi:hypothetical protein